MFRLAVPEGVHDNRVLDYLKNIKELQEAEHFDRESFYQQFGNGSTFPQVVMNGDQLGGCSETVTYLREQSII